VSGLAYYGARYYDKTLIGWTQPDSVGLFAPDSAWIEPRKSSLYTFSLNNSLRYVDPDGTWPVSEAQIRLQQAVSSMSTTTAVAVTAASAAFAREVAQQIPRTPSDALESGYGPLDIIPFIRWSNQIEFIMI